MDVAFATFPPVCRAQYFKRTLTGEAAIPGDQLRVESPPGHAREDTDMSDDKTYHGSCFCGAVQVEVTGQPEAMGYCHCDSCRHWSAAPVNAFTLWPQGALRILRGGGNIRAYSKDPRSIRKWCERCGGHLFTEHPEWKLVDVYASIIPDFPFEPVLHVNYQETVLPLTDGVPKMRDVPQEMGGTGERMEEQPAVPAAE